MEDWQISYVPHGINFNLFKPIDTISEDVKKFVHGDKEYDFVVFFNNRNIRRKQPSDVIYAFKLFCDMLPKEKSDKCLLLMKTQPVDMNGTDLYAVVNRLSPEYNIKMLETKIEQESLNEFYNIADCTINIANNEGFGLATAESLMAGTPIIVNVTGGLQDQCGFDYTADDYIEIGTLHNTKDIKHGEWAVPIWPSAINLNGSVETPYIFDDRVNDEDVARGLFKLYIMGREQRKINGQKGREWAIENLSSKIMCDTMIQGIDQTLENYKPRERFNLYKAI